MPIVPKLVYLSQVKRIALITVFGFLALALVVTNTKILGITNQEIEIILVGDTMLGRTVMATSLDKKKDPNYPFLQVAGTLKSADLVFANLENPFVTDCPWRYDGLIFCADPRMAEGLNFVNINVVTLANNHSRNYGQKGLDETTKILGAKGISYTGLNNLVIKEVKGTKFGFLGFEFVDKQPAETDYKLVSDSDKKVDILIVGVHWGVEYKSTASAKQKEIAKKLVENGADVIAGHHPHWVQEMEYIDNKPVYYSLGNFVFDQMWSQKTREGLAIKLTFKDGRIVKEEKLPIFMRNWSQPEWVE